MVPEHWIAIGLSRDVPALATRAVIEDGREIVLWRGIDGVLHAWEDRCPHRGMRLSFGFVRGNALNCLYHGWRYGADAACVAIPAHPDLTVPPTIRANAYLLCEQGGLVWLRFDRETADSPPELPPDMQAVASVAVLADATAVAMRLGAGLKRHEVGDAHVFTAWHAPAAGRVMVHALACPTGSVGAAWTWLRAFRSDLEKERAA